jgi:hypothetical protein
MAERLGDLNHEGHWPGQCRPGCPAFDALTAEQRAAQMTDAQMLAALQDALSGPAGAGPVCGCGEALVDGVCPQHGTPEQVAAVLAQAEDDVVNEWEVNE